MPKVIAVLGAGPGLGMSMAHRFGREGFTVALVSRSDVRHAQYRASLAEAGITAHSHVADVTDEAQLKRVLGQIGTPDVVYFGPAAPDASLAIVPLPEADSDALRVPFEMVVTPAARVVQAVLPGMLERGEGALLFGGGWSGKYPMPMLGSLAPSAAALRMYVLTLREALRDKGIFAATLTIGGVIEGGDIHKFVAEKRLFDFEPTLLKPDDIADTAWKLHAEQDVAEAEFARV